MKLESWLCKKTQPNQTGTQNEKHPIIQTGKQKIPTRQNQDSGTCNFKFILKGRKKINKIESSLDVEIFLGCLSCPRVFFFLIRHMLFELLHVYTCYTWASTTQRESGWNGGHVQLLICLCPPSSPITHRNTQIISALNFTWMLSIYHSFSVSFW